MGYRGMSQAEYMRMWKAQKQELWGEWYFLFHKHPQLKRNYGITGNDYLMMLEECDWSCEVCGGSDDDKHLAVDHCHTTGEVRGLLCQNCNQALGKLKDNPDLIRRLAEYVER
jgi:hypothetical protein